MYRKYPISFLLIVVLFISACSGDSNNLPPQGSTPESSLAALSNALANNDIDSAMPYVAESSQAYYQEYFEFLKQHDSLGKFSSDLRSLSLASQTETEARFSGTFTVGGEAIPVTYIFRPDISGVWRLYQAK